MIKLSQDDLTNLIKSVFPQYPDDRSLAILVDLPRNMDNDNENWKNRRGLAQEWSEILKDCRSSIPLEETNLIAYPDVGSNNADLPEEAFIIKSSLPFSSEGLDDCGESKPFKQIFTDTQIFLALTEYSTTAPLKNAAKKYGFRAATMPGFTSQMIPALQIDYSIVSSRVSLLKKKLDAAEGAEALFQVDGERLFKMFFDLRFREAHMSAGRFPDKGTAGNLPSGETYIVPYEGERSEASQTEGTLPVQIGDEIVLFTIKENSAVLAEGPGKAAIEENDRLKREPAYGNMAELGFGVLGDFGLQPIGSILLDEKLGFHVAFGRSDHFGGQVGPKDFSSPEEVIHLDRIYIPATQPRIVLGSLILKYSMEEGETLMKNGKYLIFK
jgi:hypothetical protein